MGGTSIDDQENRTCCAGDEALEKFNKDSGIDTALLLDHEPHLASRCDRRDEAHAMACAGGFDDRCFALFAPTTPCDVGLGCWNFDWRDQRGNYRPARGPLQLTAPCRYSSRFRYKRSIP